jgi:hypothetical protein
MDTPLSGKEVSQAQLLCLSQASKLLLFLAQALWLTFASLNSSSLAFAFNPLIIHPMHTLDADQDKL